MHGGRHAGAVAVPGQDVEGRRLLAHQPVGHHVAEDQVVGAQQVEGASHLAGLQDALLRHLLLQPPHRLLVGEGAEDAGLAVVEQRVEQRDRADPVVALLGQVRRQHGGQRAAQAQADDVDLGRSGDLGDDVERLARAVDEVVVQGRAAHGCVRVAVGDREHGALVLHRPLQEAATRRQVHDVVLVDPRRTAQQRHRAHLLRLRQVLQNLDEIAAVHHLGRCAGEVTAHLERRRVDLPGHPAVVADVGGEVPQPPDEAPAARFERFFDRRQLIVWKRKIHPSR